MSDILLVGWGLIGQWCLGAAIVLTVVGPRRIATRARGFQRLIGGAELLGLGCVLGIAATSYLQFLWSLAGGPLGRGCSLAFATGGPIACVVVRWRCRSRFAGNAASVPDATDPMAAAAGPLVLCCAALLGLIFVSAVIQTLLTPQRLWDERAFYGLKAIVLFEDRTIHSADLADPDFVQGHPRYPLLIPLAEQHIYALLGRVDDRWSKILFPMMFVGLVLTFAGVQSRHRPPSQAWLGALLLGTVPVLMPDDYGFLSGQADAPIACLEGVALLYLWDALAGDRSSIAGVRPYSSSLVLAALFAALAAFTKDEGIAYCGINVMSFAGAWIASQSIRSSHRPAIAPVESQPQRHSSRAAFSAIGILIVIPILVLAPWFWHRSQLPMTGEMNYFGRLRWQTLIAGIETLGWSVPHLAWRMFGEAGVWGLHWWLMLVTLLLFPLRALRPAQLFLLLNLTGALAALLLAGMIAPVDFREHIGGSSHRYLMQLAPVAVLFAIGQWQPIDVSATLEPTTDATRVG